MVFRRGSEQTEQWAQPGEYPVYTLAPRNHSHHSRTISMAIAWSPAFSSEQFWTERSLISIPHQHKTEQNWVHNPSHSEAHAIPLNRSHTWSDVMNWTYKFKGSSTVIQTRRHFRQFWNGRVRIVHNCRHFHEGKHLMLSLVHCTGTPSLPPKAYAENASENALEQACGSFLHYWFRVSANYTSQGNT